MNWGKRFITMLIVMLMGIGVFTAIAHADDIPQRIRFIGMILDRAEDFELGTYTIVVEIFDQEEDGIPLFTEEHTIVLQKYDRGIFTLEIGSEETLTLNFNRNYYLAITLIDAGGYTAGELIPRYEMNASPYGLNSDRLDGLDAKQLIRSDTDDTISGNLSIYGDMIVTGSTTEINAGDVVESGVNATSFTIDTDDPNGAIGDTNNFLPNTIAIIFGGTSAKVLEFNLDAEAFAITDNISVLGNLTEIGFAWLDGGIDVNDSRFTTSAEGNTYTYGTVTAMDNTAFGGRVYLGTDGNDAISINAEINGNMTFSDTTYIRTRNGSLTFNPANDVYLGLDIADDTIMSGDLTVPMDRLFNDTTKVLEFIDDDMTASGDVYVEGSQWLFALPDNGITFANGDFIRAGDYNNFDLNVDVSIGQNLWSGGFGVSFFPNTALRVGYANPSNFGDDSGDLWLQGDLAIGGDMSLSSDLTVGHIASFHNGVMIPEDMTVEGVLFTDQINTVGGDYVVLSIPEITYMTQDVTLSGGPLNLDNFNSLINPGNGTQGIIQFGEFAENDVIFIAQELTVLHNLSVAGEVFIDLAGTTKDSFSIDTDETSNIPRLMFKDTDADGDEYLEFNRTERVFHLSDNVSFSHELTIRDNVFVIGSGLSQFVYGNVHIGTSVTESTIASDPGDLFVQGDVELGGALSVSRELSLAGVVFGDGGVTIMGDLTAYGTMFVDTILAETNTITFGDNTQTIDLTTSDWSISTTGELDNIGSLTADGLLLMTYEGDALLVNGGSYIGYNNATSQHRIRGDTYFGGVDTLIISDDGDLDVIGSTVTLGNDVGDDFQVTSRGINVDINGAISDTDSPIVFADDPVYVFGDIAAGGALTVLGSNVSRFPNGSLSVGTKTPTAFGSTPGSMFATGDLQMGVDVSVGGDLTMGGAFMSNGSGLLFNNDFTVAGTMFIDIITTYYEAYSLLLSDVMLDNDVTLATGAIYSNDTMNINPDRFGSGTLSLGGQGEGDVINVNGDMSISGYLTIENIIYGTWDIGGTAYHSFTIDVWDRSDFPTLYLYDSDGSEYLRWNDINKHLELSDDITVDGGLTVNGDLVVEGGPGNISSFNGSDHTVFITDGRMLVTANSGTQAVPTTGFDGDGDLFIEGDLEIYGDLSFNGDMTLAGWVFSDDYIGIMGPLTVMGDMDVRGQMLDGMGSGLDVKGDLAVTRSLTVNGYDNLYIGDGTGTGNYIWFSDSSGRFGWNLLTTEFEIKDLDLSLNGDLTVNGSTYLGKTNAHKFIVTSEGLNILEHGTVYNVGRMFEIADDATIDGEVSVSDQLSVHSSATSQFTGTDTTVLINDGNLAIFSSTENIAPSAQSEDDGDLFVEDDIGVGEHVSVAGNAASLNATYIGTDSRIGNMNIQSAGLNIDNAGRIYDYDTDIIVDDDLLVEGQLSVNDLLIVRGSGLSHFDGGHVQIGPGTHVGIADDDNDLYVMGDMEAGGDISIGGDTTIAGVVFGDDYTQINGGLTVDGDLDIRGDLYNGGAGNDIVFVKNGLSLSGELTAAASAMFLGSASQVRFAGDTEQMRYDVANTEFYFTDDVHFAGELTLPNGSIPGMGSTRIDLGLAVQDQIDFIADVSVAEVLTVGKTIFIGNAIQAVEYNVIDSDGVFNPSPLMYDSNDLYVAGDIEVGGNVSMGGDTTIVGVIFSDAGTIVMDDLTVRGGLFVDSIDDETGQGIVVTDVTFNHDVTMAYSHIFSPNGLTINPDQDGDAIVSFGGIGEGDELYFNGDLYALGALTMEGISLTVSGSVYGKTAATGTPKPSFTIDTDGNSNTPALVFEDSDGDEYFRWNKLEKVIEFSDDVSVDGSLTALGDMIINGGPINVHYFNGADTALEISDGRMAILANNGASGLPSSGFNDDGDLFVGGALEIIGDLSVGGDTTIAGVVFADNFTLINGDLTVTRDIYAVRNLITAGEVSSKGPGENDIASFMNLGAITTQGGTNPGALAISEDLTVVGGNIDTVGTPLLLNAASGINQPVLLGTDAVGTVASGNGDMYVVGDIEVGGDMSLAGNLTMIGIIYSTDYILILGNLSITEHLDIRGHFLDGLEIPLDIDDEVSITGSLGVSKDLQVGYDGTGTLASGGSVWKPYNIIAHNGEVPNGVVVTGDDNDLYIGGSVESDGTFDIDNTGLMDVEGYMDLGAVNGGEGGSAAGALAISEDLTILGGNIDSPDQALLLNAAGASDQPVFIGATEHVGIVDQGGDLYVAGNVEIRKDLSIGGDTTIAGVIFGDDYTQITGSLTVDEDLDVRGNVFNGLSDRVYVDDNLVITEDLTVNNDLLVLGTEPSRFENGRLIIGTRTPSIATGADDLYISGDTEIWGNLSIGGNTTIAGVIFSDDATEVLGELTVHGNLYPDLDDTYDLGDPLAQWRNVYIDGTANIDSLIADTADINNGTIDNTIFGNTLPAAAFITDLSVTGNTELGDANTDNIIFNAELISDIVPDVNNTFSLGAVGQQWADVYLATDGTLQWDGTGKLFTFDGARFTANDDLSLEGTVNVDGTSASVIDGYLNVASTGGRDPGDMALGGDLTVEDSLRVVGTIAVGGAPIAAYNIIGDTAIVPNNANVSSDNDLLIEGTLEIDEHIDIDGAGLNDLEGSMNLGAVNGGEGGSAAGALAISEDLTILGGNIDVLNEPLKLNAGQGGSQPVFIGATTHSGIADADGDLYVAGDIEVAGDLSIGGSTTIAGVVFGDDYTQIEGDLTVSRDIYAVRNAIITGELDVNGTGMNHVAGTLEIGPISGEGGTAPGAVAIGEDLTVGGGNIDSAGQALQLNAGIASDQAVFIGTTSHSGIANADGDLYVDQDVEIAGTLSVGGDTTIGGVLFAEQYVWISNNLTLEAPLDVRGHIFDGNGPDVDVADNLSVEGDLTVYGSTRFGNAYSDGFNVISRGINIDQQGAISDLDSSVIFNDDLSVNGDVSVNDTLTVDAPGMSQFVNGRVQIGSGTYPAISNDDGDLYVVGDLELGGQLSIGEDATISNIKFSDDYLEVGVSLTVSQYIDVRGSIFDGIEDDVDIFDNLSIEGDLTILGSTRLGDSASDGFSLMSSGLNVDGSGTIRDNNSSIDLDSDVPLLGELSVGDTLVVDGSGLSQFVDGHLQIGAGTHTGIADDDGDLYVAGDVEIRQDLSIGGDTTIAGVVFGDDYTQITGSLSVADNLDLGGYLYDSGDGVIEIRGDLSLSGSTTIAGVVFGDDYTQIEGSLTATGDIDVRGTIFDGAGDIIEIGDDMSVAGYLSVADSIGITVMPGTASGEFGIDLADGSTTPTLIFTDSTVDETLLWNDGPALQTFELSDDLSLMGDITISGNRMTLLDGVYIQNTLNTTLEFVGAQTALPGDTTIGGDLTVLGQHVRMGTASLYIGDASLVVEATDTGSIFVGKDLTVAGILYAQKFAGTSFALAGTHTRTFTIHKLSTVMDQDLTLAFSDDTDDGAHYLAWDDGNDSFEHSDDVSIAGALTVRDTLLIDNGDVFIENSFAIGDIGQAGPTYSDNGGDLFVENDVEIGGSLLVSEDLTLGGVVFDQDYAYVKNNLTVSGDVDLRGRMFDGGIDAPLDILDELSVSGDLQIYGAKLYGRNNEYVDLGAVHQNTVTVGADLVDSGDTTIIGNLSVAGAIKTLDELYVNVSGDTMTGQLIINVGGEGNLALDVDGNIEYTGTLKNQSPVKFQDGIDVVNLGGICGGQLTNKDIMLFVEGNIVASTENGTRHVSIPDINFIRYTKATPEIKHDVKKVKVTDQKIYLGLGPDEHLISIELDNEQYLVNNVGLDGGLKEIGDFKITGHDKIQLFDDPAAEGQEIEISYTYRKDVKEKNHVRHSITGAAHPLGEGWQVVYVEEVAVDEITAHDTSAMSPRTRLEVRVVPLSDYRYSADTYIIAVIHEDGVVTQYH